MVRNLLHIPLFFSLLVAAACQPQVAAVPSPTFPPTQLAPLTPAATSAVRSPLSVTNTNYRVEIALFDPNGRTAISAPVGSTVTLTIAFRSYNNVVTQWSDGTTSQYSVAAPSNAVNEMRYCSGLGRTCSLPERWAPFASEQRVAIPVDWVGLKEYGVTAQFRDAVGNLNPAGPNLAERASTWVPVTGVIDERTPVASQPPRVQTAIAEARTAFPVTGSLKVGEGSITGGKAGSTINIRVQFQASSRAAPVAEMRIKRDAIGRCLSPDEMADAAWEPFAADKFYPYVVALNFTTFKLHVQYRDARGNLSTVYCGDIAVEGSP